MFLSTLHTNVKISDFLDVCFRCGSIYYFRFRLLCWIGSCSPLFQRLTIITFTQGSWSLGMCLYSNYQVNVTHIYKVFTVGGRQTNPFALITSIQTNPSLQERRLKGNSQCCTYKRKETSSYILVTSALVYSLQLAPQPWQYLGKARNFNE